MSDTRTARLKRELSESRAENARLTARIHEYEYEPNGQLRANLSNDAIQSILDKAKEHKDACDTLRAEVERLTADLADAQSDREALRAALSGARMERQSADTLKRENAALRQVSEAAEGLLKASATVAVMADIPNLPEILSMRKHIHALLKAREALDGAGKEQSSE